MFFNTGCSGAPPDPPRPRDRVKSHPHSSPCDPRRKNGRKLGERRFFKVALPEMASNHYIFRWLNGRAIDSGQAERQLNPPVSALSLFFCCTAVYDYCTHIARSWVVGGWILLLFAGSLLHDCTHTMGRLLVGG